MRFWPFRTEKKALTDAQILEMLGGGYPTSTGLQVSVDMALRVPAVAAAVRTIAEAAASLRVGVVAIDENGVETADPTHPAHDLLNGEANGWTSGFEMIRSLMVDALCRDAGGLAWVNWLEAKPTEIIRYNPGVISVDYSAEGTGEPNYRINGRPRPASDIIHLRGTFDKSPVTLCREAIAVALVMEKHAARLFGKGARPGGIIETAKSVGDSGVMKMLAGWRAAMEGAENAGKTGVLWDGATWKQMMLSSVDAQFLQLRLFQLQEIGRAFNIPAVMLGDLSRATWSNSAEMQRMFLLLCLEPWLKALESALRRALIAKEDRKRFAIRFERDDFSKVDLSVLAVAINGLVSSRTINPNEGRDWLGLAPRKGGEEFANPNTGASQPGIGHNGGPKLDDAPKPANDPDSDDPEKDDDA